MPKRRTKGDGGLIQRHDHPTCPPAVNGVRPKHTCQGRWVGTTDVIDPTSGRKRRKYVYGRTQKQAKAKLDAALREKERGTLVVASDSVETWMRTWLDRKARTLKPQTLRSYESKTTHYITPHLGHHRLTVLRAAHIEAMYDAMRANGLAEATVRQTHAILKKALSDAVKRDKLGVSPMDKVEAPSTEKNVRASLGLEDARRVLRAAGDDARWWLALFYGLRQGEALGLRWGDVNFEAHTLTIAQTLQTDAHYRIIFGPPKSASSRRTIPLVPMMESRLRLHYINSGEPSPDALVFSDNGSPIWPNDDWQAWRDLLVRATIPPLAPVPHVALHAARNSAASLLEAAGVPDRLVAQILGHSQVQITHGYQSADLERMSQALTAYGVMLELE